MAKFQPPESFCFERPGEWTEWKKRFARYRTATKLDKEDGPVQVSTLVYALGKEAESILGSFTYNEGEDESDYDTVLAKFEAYFIPRRNVIHERACFNQRMQRPGERAETFIRALYELSENCVFGINRTSETGSWWALWTKICLRGCRWSPISLWRWLYGRYDSQKR